MTAAQPSGPPSKRGTTLDLARSRAVAQPAPHGTGEETGSRSPHSLSPTCERPSTGPRRACNGRAGGVSDAQPRAVVTPASGVSAVAPASDGGTAMAAPPSPRVG